MGGYRGKDQGGGKPLTGPEAGRQPPGLLPAFFYCPFDERRLFVGRDGTLAELRDALLSSERQAITGIAGIGKTQLAVEYAYRYRSEYSSVFWCEAGSTDALNAGWRRLAQLAGVAVTQEPTWTDALRHKLEQARGNWLVIFDGVENPSLLRPLLPNSGGGHILLTSWDRELDRLGIHHPLRLDELEWPEATRFLLSRTGREQSEGAELQAASELACDQLGALPLAIEQAGAYIAKVRSTFELYLSEFRSKAFGLLERGVPANYPLSLLRTLSRTLDRLAEHPPSLELARTIAFLDEDSLPRRFLERAAAELAPAGRPGFENIEQDRLALNEALAPLFDYALVRDAASLAEFRTHNLVRVAIRELTPTDQRDMYEAIAVKTCSIEVEDFDFLLRVYPVETSTHGLAAARLALARRMTSIEAGRLFRKIGGRLLSSDARAAQEMLTSAIDIISGALGANSPELVPALLLMAAFQGVNSGMAAARVEYERALAIADPETQADLVTIAQNNLGELSRKSGDFEGAEQFLMEALATRVKIFGEEHQAVATVLNNLGNLYGAQRDFRQALEFYRQSYAIRQRILTPPHPHLANSLNNLGWVYVWLKWPKAAEPALQEALEMWTALYGPVHPEVAVTLRNLADLYDQTRRAPLARKYREMARQAAEGVRN